MTRRARTLLAIATIAPALLLTAGGCQHDDSLTIENVVLVRAGTPTARDLQYGQPP